MTDELITSRKNPFAQYARGVRNGRERESVFIEGLRLCEEALRAGMDFEYALHTRGLEGGERGERLLASLREVGAHVAAVREDVFESVSDTVTPQGVVAIARRPKSGPELLARVESVPLVVILHCSNNPSNAGAALRVAEAAGATGVIATRGSTDLFSPKSLRGSMGSAFRMAVWMGASFEEALAWCAERGIRAVATDARARRTRSLIGRGRAPSYSGRRRAGSRTKRFARAKSLCAYLCASPSRV